MVQQHHPLCAPHGRERRHTGSAVVEFALILPVLVVLTMGVIECGNLFFAWLTVQKAASTATRFAATGLGDIEGDRLTRILARATAITDELSGGETTVEVCSWPTTDTSGPGLEDDPGGPCEVVEVSVVYDYHPVTPIVGAAMPDPISITGADRKINEPWRPCSSYP